MRRHLLLDPVHLGDAGLDVARVDHEAAEGEPGVQFDVPGADHTGVLHGPFCGEQGSGARFVEHAPGGDQGEHLGVHLRRGQTAHQVPGGGEFLPPVAARLGGDETGALDPEPGGAQRIAPVLQDVQRPFGDLQGPFALPDSRPATAASAIRSR